MSAIVDPIDEVWICLDCMIAHEDGHLAEVAGVTPITDMTANWDSNDESGIHVFSGAPCGTCGTGLAGYRYRYAVWAW